MALTTLSVSDFLSQRENFGNIVHIKGFGRGITANWKDRALSAIGQSCSAIAWDGDPPKNDSFTALIEIFLRSDSKNVAIAFKDTEKLDTFSNKWEQQLKEFGSRIIVVYVDKSKDTEMLGLAGEDSFVKTLPALAREFYVLGRVAIKCTGSKHVVAVGGGGIAGKEAAVSLNDGVHWTIFAVSRGEHETQETLLDWAKGNPDPNLDFVTGFDPNEAKGYKSAQTRISCFAWCCKWCFDRCCKCSTMKLYK